MNLSYAGIAFQIVKTNDFSMEAVRTDDEMDLLYYRCHLDVSGVLNPQAMSFVRDPSSGAVTATPGTLPATTAAAIRHALLAERGQLLLTDYAGQTLLEAPSLDSGGFPCDIKGGPFPRVCQVKEVVGSRTFLIRYVIDAFILECPGGQPNNRLILSNRWSDSAHINADHLTTRTASGKVVFNLAAVTESNTNIDNSSTRALILPIVAPGFQRTSVDIIRESSGASMIWRVTDEERVYALGETDARAKGSGITRLNGSHGIRSMNTEAGGPTAGMSLLSIDIKAWLNTYGNQWKAIERLFELVASIVNVGDLTIGFITSASLRRSLDQDEKWIELSLMMLLQPDKGQAVIGNLRVDSLKRDVSNLFAAQGDGINPGLPNGGYGSATVELVGQILSFGGPCVPLAPPSPGDDAGQGGPNPPAGPAPPVSVQTEDELPEYTPRYGPPPQDGSMYTDYSMSMKWNIDNGTIKAPKSSGGSGGGGGHTDPTTGGWIPDGTPSAAIFRISLPHAELICEGTAESAGAPPNLPALTSTDPNLVLKSAMIMPVGTIIANDASTPIYRVWFKYHYHLKAAFNTQNPTLAMGVLPWTSIAFTDNFLTPGNFVDGILSDPDGGSLTGDDGGSTGSDT